MTTEAEVTADFWKHLRGDLVPRPATIRRPGEEDVRRAVHAAVPFRRDPAVRRVGIGGCAGIAAHVEDPVRLGTRRRVRPNRISSRFS